MPAAYIPALKYHFLTPIYDWFIRLTMPELKVKNRLIQQAELHAGEKILDFGCGTATLTLLIEEQTTDCVIISLDTDPQIMAIAKKKISQKKSAITLLIYDGKTFPFPDRTFDKVISSWVFQHLTTPQKIASFKEINRVLKSQGELHIADWGKAETKLMRLLFFVVQVFDNFYTTNDNIKGKLPQLIQNRGFQQVEIVGNQSTLFGTLSYFKAVKT
jgi:ubiquinone/menaquinone biosynthesis C-methylase UbiE